MAKRHTSSDFETQIIAHAWKDKEFKKRLLANPKAAIRELGYDLPENLHFEVKEQKSNTVTIMLPPSPASAQNLSEDELRQVAGGCRYTTAGGNTNVIKSC